MRHLYIDYPTVPESVNKLYFVRGGRKVLSTSGRKYKNEFLLSRGNLDAATFMQFAPEPEARYSLTLWFFLRPDRLYNLTYGVNRRVKSPFADIDTSNMIKLFEDCISELTGIRDRNNFSIHAHKREAPGGIERVRAILKPLDDEEEWEQTTD
ncbi:hypothetical protein EB061_11635 [bacterium]|nr:hypothetical protein [bacterium]